MLDNKYESRLLEKMIKTQEHIKEAIYVISIYCDLLGVKFFSIIKNRNFDYKYKILKYSKVTIISLESATLHPLQSLPDIFIINKLRLNKKK